jgi:NTP pyrophosphatase (non-canonical NTP hydrolase)
MIGFNEYQEQAATTAVFNPEQPVPGVYTALGLNGEAGEVAEKIKKYWRDGGDYAATREAVRKELGDVLWYLAMTAREWSLDLQDVAETNLTKLADRRKRNQVHGSGDNR